ncbi:MAG: amidase family protein, partial [Pseudomonadota bacterium]
KFMTQTIDFPQQVTRHPPLQQLADRLRMGGLSAIELYQDCSQADHHDAYITGRDEAAGMPGLAQAQAADAALKAGHDLGPLMGLPYGLKDLYGYPDLPVYAGSDKALPPPWQRPGPLVQAVRRQLGVLMGKTHTVCFAFGGVGLNSQWATPKNPWDTDHHRAPGGSSSGSGVSVAEGSSLYAFGTDTAGSVRIPASVNGLVGYKSTAGVMSTEGIVPLSTTLDSAGFLTRSVADACFVTQALLPHLDLSGIAAPSQIKIQAVTGRFIEDTDPSILAVYQRALDVLGPVVRQVISHPSQVAEDALALFEAGSVVGVELAARLDNQLPDWWEGLDPLVASRIAASREMQAHTYLDRRYQIQALTAAMTHSLEDQGVDVLVLPSLPISPPVLDELTSDDDGAAYRAANMAMLRNTCFANITGMCGLSLPIGLDDNGMPVGLQLLAPGGKDAQLLAIGRGLEVVFAQADLWPSYTG